MQSDDRYVERTGKSGARFVLEIVGAEAQFWAGLPLRRPKNLTCCYAQYTFLGGISEFRFPLLFFFLSLILEIVTQGSVNFQAV